MWRNGSTKTGGHSRVPTPTLSGTACRSRSSGTTDSALRRFPKRRERDFLLDIPADLPSHLNTRVVVPLLPRDGELLSAGGLNSVVEIEDGGWVMAIQFMAPVARLDAVRAEITTALDMVF